MDRHSGAFVVAMDKTSPCLPAATSVDLSEANMTPNLNPPRTLIPLPPRPSVTLCHALPIEDPPCRLFTVQGTQSLVVPGCHHHHSSFNHIFSSNNNSFPEVVKQSSSPILSSPEPVNENIHPSFSPFSSYFDYIDSIISQVKQEIYAEKALYSANCFGQTELPDTDSEVIRKRSYASAFQPSPPAPSSLGSSCNSSLPSSSPGSSEISSFTDSQQPRAKKFSLMGMSLEEMNERKKQQNKIAARRYRSRKMEMAQSNKDEISRLENRNSELRNQEASLSQQIAALKDLMIQQMSKF